MQNSKKNSFSKNIIFSVISWIFTLGLGFVATPIILHGLGEKEYGVYVLILDFFSYSFAFGLGRAITKFVAEYEARNEPEKAAQVITVTIFLNLVISLIAITVLLFFSRWFVVDVLKIDDDLQEKAVTAFYLTGFLISATMFSQVFGAVIQAFQRFDIYSIILVFSNGISTLGNIFLIYFGFRIEALFVWNLITVVLTTLIFLLYAFKMLSDFRMILKISAQIVKDVLKYNSAVIAMQLSGNILLLFERIWITRYFGSTDLTYYVIPMKLSFLIHIFINSFIVVIFPFASESHALGETEKLLSVYKKATKIVTAMAVFFALTIILGRFTILKHWVGANFAEHSSEILIFHTLTFSLVAVGTIFWQIVEGIGFPQYTALISFVWLVISSILMIIFSNYFSLDSLAAARFAGVLIFIPSILLVEKIIFKGVLWEFWKRILIFLTVAGGTAILIQYVISISAPDNIIYWFLGSILSGGVFLGVLFYSGFLDEDEMIWLREITRRLR